MWKYYIVLLSAIVTSRAAPGYVNGGYGSYGYKVPTSTSYVTRTDYLGKGVPVAVGTAVPVVPETFISAPGSYKLGGYSALEPGYQYSGLLNTVYDYGQGHIDGSLLSGSYGYGTSAGGHGIALDDNYGHGVGTGGIHGIGAPLKGSYGYGTTIGSGLLGYGSNIGGNYGHLPTIGGSLHGYGSTVGGSAGHRTVYRGASYDLVGGNYGSGGRYKYGVYDH